MKRRGRPSKPEPDFSQRGDAKIFRQDGWANALTGLGDANRDKRVNAGIVFTPVVERVCEDIYGADDTAGKVVDLPTEESTRNWFDFTGMEPAAEAALNAEFERLYFRERLTEAYRLSRIYGGAGLIPMCEGGGDLMTPLDPEQVLRIKSIIVMSRFELVNSGNLVSDIGSPYFGLPASYGLNPRGQSTLQPQRIHHTRVIRIEGSYLPRTLFQQNSYWHDSVLNKVINAIRNYATSFDSAAGLILDYRQGILSSAGIAERISAGKEDEVKNRLRVFNLTRSVLSTMLIDKELETYEQQTFPLTGVADILTKMENRVASAADIPRTKLFGESATGGLGNEGKSQKKDWQAKVAGIQDTRLRPPTMQMIKLISCAKTFPQAARNAMGKNYSIKYRPIEVLDDQETAELRNKQQQTDTGYITSGVLLPEEVTLSRFGGRDGYSMETKIDVERLKNPEQPNAGTAT